MKCIKCGNDLEPIFKDKFIGLLGYQCLNCKDEDRTSLSWTLAEHKDNQNWAVRHIRALEARVLILEQSLDSLLKKLGV